MTRRSGAAPILARMARAALLALVPTLAAACGGGDGDGRPGAGEVPRPAPSFAAVTLAGDSVALSSLQDEVVLLNVWATWCAPCRKEIPELQALHETYGPQGLHVVGVTVDHRGAGEEIRAFMDQFGMTYDVWWDPAQSVVSTFDAVGVPLTVLIDRQGRIVWEHLGAFERGDPALLAAIRAALGGSDPGGRI